MKGKIKFLEVLFFATVLILSICGCKAKDEPDTSSDTSVSATDQSEPQVKDVQQTPDNQSDSIDSAQSTSPSSSQQEPATDGSGTSTGGAGGTGTPNEKIPNTVIVIIEENRVFINEAEYKDAEELKTYIESVNNDSRVFRLFEDQAIQATHDWVMDVFRELQVEVVFIPNG